MKKIKIGLAAVAIASLFTLGLAKLSTAVADARTMAELTAVMNGPQRSPDHKARDRYRHPVQTLTFFGIKPDMAVVEIWPGPQGWYSEILAPFLRDHGKLYEAISPRNKEKFHAKLAADPAVYGKVTVTELAPPEKTEIAPPGSADMVLTFRNVHDWLRAGPDAAEPYFQAFYRALKPGGILGVVDHCANPKLPYDPKAMSGYVRPNEMIRLAEKAGFKLAGRSDINANPKDDTNHPKGVWTLPPTLRLGDKDRAKYLAIGESNRMTLKFVKPKP